VIAPEHRKEPPRVRVLAFLDVFDPGSKLAQRNFILGLASDGARVAANAFAVIDDETVSHRALKC
jgi:hypothetical protein